MPFVILSILMALIVAAVPVAAVLGILSLSLDELFMRVDARQCRRLRMGTKHRIHSSRDPDVYFARGNHAHAGIALARIMQ